MIIDPENQNNQNNGMDPNPDEFVDSSFIVSFKNNEDSTVSDAIKENNNPFNSIPSDDYDEFDNFNYDESKSAFKPLSKPVEIETEPPKASEKKDFEQVAGAGDPAFTDPAFTDGNLDFKEFTGIDSNVDSSETKLFEAGQDLDFAASTASNSSFSGGMDDEFKLDDEALAINPFKPKNADRIPPAPSKPKTAAPKTESPAPVADPDNKETSKLKTYGKVSSGVDAFKKPSPFNKTEDKKPSAPAPAPVPASVNANAPRQDHTPSIMKAFEDAPKAPAQVPVQPPVKEPVKKEEAVSPFVAPEKAAVDNTPKKPVSNAAKVLGSEKKAAAHEAPVNIEKPVVKAQERPAAAAAIPEEKESGSRPGTSKHTSAPKTTHNTKIDPVTQVSKPKKRSSSDKKVKEPGKGGIIALICVLAGIFVVLWVLDNYQQWFAKTDENTTRATQVTAVTTVDEQSEPEETEAPAETAAAVVTEESVEATTEAPAVETEETEVTEQTTEPTEETTVETTEETTEATTTTTEEETTATTTRSSSSSDSPVRCSYDIANPRVTSDGFVFDFAITNNGDNLNVSRLNEITISFNTSSEITSLTSDYFTFTSDGNNSFTGTPRTGSLPAGETTNITITGTTESHVQHFYINTYHFDWD